MSSNDPTSLLGKRKREKNNSNENNDNNNDNNNGPVNGFSLVLRPNSNIRRPSTSPGRGIAAPWSGTKRARMNIPPPPPQGPTLARQSAIVPGAPRKAPRPGNLPFTAPVPHRGEARSSALKGTNPKILSRGVSHTPLPPTVTTYELNNNTTPMVHMNSQTNRKFERYILPCLRDKIPDEEIQELYDTYVSLQTEKRGKQPNRPSITKESAIVAHIHGIIYDKLQSINGLNIPENATKNVPPEFGDLPEQQRTEIFRAIGHEISSTYEGRESNADVARIILYALGKFRRYLPASFVAQVTAYLNNQIMPTQGGKRRTNKRKRSTRSTRKN